MKITIKEKKKLIENIDQELVKHSHWFWNCPSSIIYLNKFLKNYIEQFGKKDLVAEAEYISYRHWLLQHSSLIKTEELLANINRFKEALLEKLELAKESDKKVLVILTEEHSSNHSYLFEVLLLTILKSYKFNSLLYECSEEELKIYLEKDFPFLSMELFTNRILKMDVHGVDPYHHTGNFNIRDKSIAESVAKHDNENQVLIIGGLHLNYLLMQSDIKKNFEILSVKLEQNKAKLAESLQQEYNKAKINWHLTNIVDRWNVQHDLEISLSNFIESFSTNELYSIYSKLLPELMGLKPQAYNDQYTSLPKDHYEKCSYYPEIEAKIAHIESKLSWNSFMHNEL